MDSRWRIEQLSHLVALALETSDYDGQGSGRTRDVPDVRTIRYYTTLGLVDRPSEMRGRTAFYGRRHLLQLVAIKRLQAQGMSLGDVQARLVGVGQKKLAALAALPDDFWERAKKGPEADESPAPRSRSRSEFWRAAPVLPSTEAAADGEIPAPAVVLPVSANVRLLVKVSTRGN
jgi:DNA-binding transcriptional MerR regulator